MQILMAIRLLRNQNIQRTTVRPFHVFYRSFEKSLPPRLIISETDIDESFLKGSGPGGQKINKTSSAVQLKHLPTGLVVKSQETRSREQNRKIARRILAEKLEVIEKGDQSRTALKADKARKKKASASKKSKRKYKKLESEKQDDESGQDLQDKAEIPGTLCRGDPDALRNGMDSSHDKTSNNETARSSPKT